MTRLAITTDDAPAPAGPYSQGIVAGGLVFAAGQGGFDPDTGELVEGIEAQTELAFRNVDAVLRAAGSSLEHAVKISVFLRDLSAFQRMNAVYARFAADPPAVRTTVQAGLAPGMEIEIDAIALVAAHG